MGNMSNGHLKSSFSCAHHGHRRYFTEQVVDDDCGNDDDDDGDDDDDFFTLCAPWSWEIRTGWLMIISHIVHTMVVYQGHQRYWT